MWYLQMSLSSFLFRSLTRIQDIILHGNNNREGDCNTEERGNTSIRSNVFGELNNLLIITNSRLKRSIWRRFSRARTSRQMCANKAILEFLLMLIPGQFMNKTSIRPALVNKRYSLLVHSHMNTNELNHVLLLFCLIAGLLWCIFFKKRVRPLQF